MKFYRVYSKSSASNPEINEIEEVLCKIEKKLGIEIYAKLESDELGIIPVIAFNKK